MKICFNDYPQIGLYERLIIRRIWRASLLRDLFTAEELREEADIFMNRLTEVRV